MNERIKRSLRYSLIDGIFASVMTGFGDAFITPYAIAMKAGAGLIGILASMPNLAGSLLQVKVPALVDRLGSRKAVINTTVLIHALLWLPIIAIPYIFKENRVIYLIAFYTLFVSMGLVSFPPWSSLMADHVRETERGKIFGRRNKIFGIINILGMLTAGAVLYLFQKIPVEAAAGISDGGIFLGFTTIFSVAFVSRLVSWHFLTKMYEPELVIKDEHRFTMFDFLRRMRKSNFGRFVAFIGFMNFSVQIAAPFFSVYMLRDLKFDYLTYAVINMTTPLTMVLMMGRWGARADHVGNIKVMRFTSLFIPFIPILWVVSPNVIYLICVQVFAGFFWAGFNLSSSNFIYDAVSPEKRIRCIAYFNVVNGVAIFSGATLGGYLVRFLPPFLGYRILTLLLISGILRFIARSVLIFVREVRGVKDVSSMQLFYSVISRKPLIAPAISERE